MSDAYGTDNCCTHHPSTIRPHKSMTLKRKKTKAVEKELTTVKRPRKAKEQRDDRKHT